MAVCLRQWSDSSEAQDGVVGVVLVRRTSASASWRQLCLGFMKRPGFDAPGVFQLFVVVAMSFACVLHFDMSSCALHHHVFQNLHPVTFFVVRFVIRHSHTRPSPLLDLVS